MKTHIIRAAAFILDSIERYGVWPLRILAIITVYTPLFIFQQQMVQFIQEEYGDGIVGQILSVWTMLFSAGAGFKLGMIIRNEIRTVDKAFRRLWETAWDADFKKRSAVADDLAPPKHSRVTLPAPRERGSW